MSGGGSDHGTGPESEPEAAPHERSVRALGTLRHREFARFITGATSASVGQFLSGLTTPFIMNELTDSNTWVGMAGFAGLFPAVLLTPISGILADRISRRSMLVAAYLSQMVVQTALLVLYSSGALTPWRIIGLSIVSGTIAGFQFAPTQAMPGVLVPHRDLVGAVQLLSISFTVGRAVGPGIAALVLAFAGPGLAYGIAVVLFGLGAVALWHTTPIASIAPSARRGLFTDFREGIAYVAARPPLRLAVGLAFVIGMLAATWAFSLAASVADDVFSLGGGGLGSLATALGCGSVLASIFISRSGDAVPRSRMEITALCLYVAGLLVTASTSIFVVGLLGYLLLGTAHMWHNVTLATSMQVQLDEEYRGRAMSVWLLAVLSGIPIGSIIGGVLGDALSVRAVIVIFAVVLFAVSMAAWLSSDRFRILDAQRRAGAG